MRIKPWTTLEAVLSITPADCNATLFQVLRNRRVRFSQPIPRTFPNM